jgi:hypothetical protein
MSVRRTSGGRPRSVAWVYYAIITALLVIAAFSTSAGALLGALITGAYSTYLFRGGRFVLWIW